MNVGLAFCVEDSDFVLSGPIQQNGPQRRGRSASVPGGLGLGSRRRPNRQVPEGEMGWLVWVVLT